MVIPRILAIAGALALPLSSFARLGETESELTARFGQPTNRGKENTFAQGKLVEFGTRLTFHQGEWTITSVVIEGHCAREIYYKPGDWTEEQFTLVLTSNAQGTKWNDVSKPLVKKVSREWRRDDAATASWSGASSMFVTHPAYARAKELAEVKAKAEAGRLPKN